MGGFCLEMWRGRGAKRWTWRGNMKYANGFPQFDNRIQKDHVHLQQFEQKGLKTILIKCEHILWKVHENAHKKDEKKTLY